MFPGSPVGPEDDRFYTRCHSRENGNPGVLKSLRHIDFSFLWISGSSPKMTKENKRPEDDNS